jgi:FAD/FMN-containing dehydrogenase
VSLRKKAPPHQVPKAHDLRRRDPKIDISDLTQILDIDPVARTCTAEAGVAFVDLVRATLRHGLVPIVVPELESITIGGAVSGCSIESMSYRYGGFHDTCLAYEVITASGDVLSCTATNEHALVFHMMHGSFGTLGILARLTFRLVPAKPFVRVDYEHHTTLASYRAAIQRHFAAEDVDFMDGIIHAPDHLVLCVGRFVDTAPYTSRYDWMKIYYLSTTARDVDYLATPDYLFRYDRGVTNVHPKSWLGRLVFGKLTGSQHVLRLAERLPFLLSESPDVTLDLFLPFSKVPAFLDWYQREVGHFPLWCVPYRRVHDYEWLADSFYAGMEDRLFLDLAIYGMKQPPGKNVHRMLEEKLRELGGVKTLIAHNYYSRDEFWSIWNKRNYDAVKAITDPSNLFRDLYTKTCRTAMGLE